VGYITRINGNKGRTDERGRGFELATQLWGVVRAMQGLAITTDTRGAAAPVKDVNGAVQRLIDARQQHEDLSALAKKHQAQDAMMGQHDAVQTIKTQNDAIKGGKLSLRDNPFPEMTRPDLTLASAAGIATTAADSTHQASGSDHSVTAGRDYSGSAGRHYHFVARGTISMFAYQQGMKFYAAHGPVQIQAQAGPMGLAAQGDIEVTSDGKIIITAKDELWLGANGSYIRINGSGIINGSPGPILEKTPHWSKEGADSATEAQQKFFESQAATAFSQQFQLDDTLLESADGSSSPVKYHFMDDDGNNLGAGTIGEDGKTLRLFTKTAKPVWLVADVNNGKTTTLFWQEPFYFESNDWNDANAVVFDYPEHGS